VHLPQRPAVTELMKLPFGRLFHANSESDMKSPAVQTLTPLADGVVVKPY
jgi:hypothetical protein